MQFKNTFLNTLKNSTVTQCFNKKKELYNFLYLPKLYNKILKTINFRPVYFVLEKF